MRTLLRWLQWPSTPDNPWAPWYVSGYRMALAVPYCIVLLLRLVLTALETLLVALMYGRANAGRYWDVQAPR